MWLKLNMLWTHVKLGSPPTQWDIIHGTIHANSWVEYKLFWELPTPSSSHYAMLDCLHANILADNILRLHATI